METDVTGQMHTALADRALDVNALRALLRAGADPLAELPLPDKHALSSVTLGLDLEVRRPNREQGNAVSSTSPSQ